MKGCYFKRTFTALAFLVTAAFFGGCREDNSPSNPGDPLTMIAVISDPHSYDLSLGHSGLAWQQYLMSDRKLLDENEAIFDAFIKEMKCNRAIKVVLVCGDMTKDGEASSHSKMAGKLREIEKTGKRVYVIPGNHDVSNPFSRSYHTDLSEPAPNITAAQFASIYDDFGYKEAIARDPNSLSYVVEPAPGVWIIAMDAARYRENTSTTLVHDGKFYPETLAWIKQKLTEAKCKGKRVIGFMHHGMIEHFTGQKSLSVSAEYVIDDWNIVAPQLAGLGLRLVFTGHFHANDVTALSSGGNTIFDVETASLIGYPSSYRVVGLMKNGMVNIWTKLIQTIDYPIPGGLTFQLYAEQEIRAGMTGLAAYILEGSFGLPHAQALYLAPFVGDAFVRHYKGDETIPPDTQAVIAMLKSDPASAPLGYALESMLTDLAPPDNCVSLNIPFN
ncbi:MAG: metallophosphoesterase family protein [Chloroflexota bacterium]